MIPMCDLLKDNIALNGKEKTQTGFKTWRRGRNSEVEGELIHMYPV